MAKSKNHTAHNQNKKGAFILAESGRWTNFESKAGKTWERWNIDAWAGRIERGFWNCWNDESVERNAAGFPREVLESRAGPVSRSCDTLESQVDCEHSCLSSKSRPSSSRACCRTNRKLTFSAPQRHQARSDPALQVAQGCRPQGEHCCLPITAEQSH